MRSRIDEQAALQSLCKALRWRGFERTQTQVKEMLRRDAGFNEEIYADMLDELCRNELALDRFIYTMDERPTMFIQTERKVPVFPMELFALSIIVAACCGFLAGMLFRW